MKVALDEAGVHRRPSGVYVATGDELARDVGVEPDPDDGASLYGHRPTGDQATLGIHGEDVAVTND